MSPTRDPFAFLDAEAPQRRVLLLLLAILRKQGGELTLTLEDLTAIEDGASFHKYPSDTGTSLVLRFARKGAEAYFLTPPEADPSTPARSPSMATATRHPKADADPPPYPSPSAPTRHAVHDDLDLAMREEEMATRATRAQQERLRQARADAGAMPWRTQPPTRPTRQ
jgi:hypothetical protein